MGAFPQKNYCIVEGATYIFPLWILPDDAAAASEYRHHRPDRTQAPPDQMQAVTVPCIAFHPAQAGLILMKLKTVQQRIKRQGLAWTAAETTRSPLTRKQLLDGSAGAISSNELRELSRQHFDASSRLQQLLDASAETTAPPSSFSWLDAQHVVSEPKDQGTTCNSCVAFAVIAAVEARMNIQCNLTVGDLNLSEAMLFYGGCGNCCANGWYLHSALDHCIRYGLVADHEFPYQPTYSAPPTGIAAAVRLQRKQKIGNVADIQRTIAARGPVVAEMDLYQDFTFYRDGVYEPTGNAPIGTHAVCIIGYDNQPQDDVPPYWVCKNSWGTDWGCSPLQHEVGSDIPATRGFFCIAQGAAGLAKEHHVWDFDLELVLTPAEAAKAMEAICRKIATSTPLRRCLQQIIDPHGFMLSSPEAPSTECDDHAVQNILQLTDDLCAIYSPLRTQLMAALNAPG